MMNKKSSTQKNSIKKIKITDVVPCFYGVIEKKDGKDTVVVLINKGEERPCSVTKSYFTEYDNQQSMNFTLTSSSSLETDPTFVTIEKEVVLELPPGRPAGQEVKATFSFDDDGVMQASFKDVESGKAKDLEISPTGGTESDSNNIDRFTVDTEPKTESNKIGAFVGIDLGTAYSRISYIDETGNPKIVNNSEGQGSTPSCILVEGDTAIVGEVARKELGLSDNVLARFKRDMGTSVKYNVNGKDYTPTECSALVLKKLVQDAKKQIGEIGVAVVTVPADFSNEARVATLTAAQLAGLEVVNIVDEPIAAALYYVFKSGNRFDGHYAIYNLGDAEFDISIIKVEGQIINMVASDGVSKLGGDDFDLCLQKLVKKKFKDEHDEKLEEQDYTITDAEEDKKSLSKREKVNVRSNNKNIKVTRAEFEQEISFLITQTEMLCESILNETNLTAQDIQEVFLVGGNTRVPSVEDTIKRVFGKTPVRLLNVNQVVVLGTSIYAAWQPIKPPPPPDPAPTPVQQASVIDSEDDYSKIDKFLVD